MSDGIRYHRRYHSTMGNVLIRDVPENDMQVIKDAAARDGRSVQAYLLATLCDRAAYERRQAALRALDEHLAGETPLTDKDRDAVDAAVSKAIDQT